MPTDAASPLDRFKAWWTQPATRQRLRILGVLLLLAGVAWSVTSLDLAWSDLSISYLTLNAMLLTPLVLVLAALTFRVTVQAAGADMSIAQSLRVVVHANVAEILPIPGGALVRGAALLDAGVKVGVATQLVLLTAFLTLGLTIALASVALALLQQAAWFWLTLACAIGVAVVLWLIARHATPRDLFWMVVLRLVSLIAAAIRLAVAFAALGQVITWLEGAIYVVAPTLGAAVGIFPAGLGLNEALAAGLATLLAASPATAFLAVALDRVLTLAVGAVFVFAGSVVERIRG